MKQKTEAKPRIKRKPRAGIVFNTAKKKEHSGQLANAALADMIKFHVEHTWFAQALSEDMSRACGGNYWRQEIAAWLHADPAQRVEPRLGAALLLLEKGHAIMKTFAKSQKAKAA